MTWERTPLGLETAAPVSRAARAGSGGAGKTLKSPSFEVPALHREAERDTTGNFGRQHHLHTWIGMPVQGSRRHTATLPLFGGKFKARLTLWFYCGKRAARRHGSGGGPRKSPCIPGFRAIVRRSMLWLAARRNSLRPKPSRRSRLSPPDSRSPPRLAWPATASRPASFSISTSRSRSTPFALADPYRVVVDLPQVSFHLPPGVGVAGRGLIKAFRYGLVMPGGSRIVFDLTGPAKITNASVLQAANGQPPRLVLELEEVDRTTFVQQLAPESRPELRPAIADAKAATLPVSTVPAKPESLPRRRRLRTRVPSIVIDPGHGGPDNGTQWDGASEKTIVLAFALALRDRIEKSGKYRVVMTRTDDTFIPLDDRVKFARSHSASLFVSIHADALPRREGDAQGATIYTLSDRASDAEAERLAEAENKADAIGGVNLTRGAHRGRRHPDRPRPARNPNLLQPFCAPVDERK